MKALAEKQQAVKSHDDLDRRRSARALDGSPAALGRADGGAPLQAALDRSARVRSQGGLRAALDRSPRVVAEAQRGEALGARALQRQPAAPGATPVVQRALSRSGRSVVRGGATLAGATGLGYALSGFGLPGILGGGLVGGLAGYLAPDLVRWARSGNVWDEVNRGDRDYRTHNTPQNLADQLARESSAFRALRTRASDEVRDVHGRGLSYQAAADDVGGHSAAYGHGIVRVDEDSLGPAFTVQNLIFETANAAQSRFFETLRADYANGSMGGKTIQHYAKLLGRNPDELGGLADAYGSADLEERRSILQEWGEWNSLELSRATFKQIAPRFKSGNAQDALELGFGPRLAARSFGAYYKDFGEDHRSSVLHSLRKNKQKLD